MRTQSIDTIPIIEEKLIELLRRKTNTERLSMALSLSSFTMRLSKRAIERTNPGKSKRELDLLFVEYRYGKELAKKLDNHLKKMEHGEE